MRESKDALEIGTADKFLLNLDEGASGALYRALIGFAIIPAMRLIIGTNSSDWTLILFLLLVLLLLRVGLAVVRKVVPFSAEVREAWSVRRRKAKLYDSYQWRKLMWIGVGLALYIVISSQYWPIQILLSMFCFVTGAAAEVRWRTIVADSEFPKPMAKKIKGAAA